MSVRSPDAALLAAAPDLAAAVLRLRATVSEYREVIAEALMHLDADAERVAWSLLDDADRRADAAAVLAGRGGDG